jgi:hypothetical protein
MLDRRARVEHGLRPILQLTAALGDRQQGDQ